MYKLYDMTSHSLMDISKDEIDIIKTISSHINLNSTINFLIVYHNEELNMDDFYRRIKSKEEFKEYYADFKERNIKDLTCVQLKGKIISSLRR